MGTGHVDLCIGLLYLVVRPTLKPTTKVVGILVSRNIDACDK